MAVRKCNWCNKQYHVYDSDAGTFLEHFCSQKCNDIVEDAISEEMERNPPMMNYDLPAEF